MTYQECIDCLTNSSQDRFRTYLKKVTNTNVAVLGCNAPTVRSLAKNCSDEILSFHDNAFYEVDLAKAYYIGLTKRDFNEKAVWLNAFLPFIDNWAVCDSLCCNFRVKKQDKQRLFEYVLPLFSSKEQFVKRFAVVMCLSHFLDEEHLDIILQHLGQIEYGQYYVDMAVAWLLSCAFISYKDKVCAFLSSGRTNAFVVKKTVQKINESFRVTKADKEYAKMNVLHVV